MQHTGQQEAYKKWISPHGGYKTLPLCPLAGTAERKRTDRCPQSRLYPAQPERSHFKARRLLNTLFMAGLFINVNYIVVPIFLFVRQQEFALYNGETFVLNINKELFELLQKRLNDFTIKAFDVNAAG